MHLGLSMGLSRRGGASAAFNPASLFTTEAGGYWDFTDATKLAVNSDGTGGSPAVDAACRWAVDQSPNLNHLRNTVTSVTRRSNGIETSGANYGLFNFAGFGNWPTITQPLELWVTMELLAAETADDAIISSVGLRLLAGSASGKVRPFAGAYGTEYTPGLTTEFTLGYLYNGASSFGAMNSATLSAATSPSTGTMEALCLGSDTGGNVPTQVRFKRLLVISRALTAGERTSLYAALTA